MPLIGPSVFTLGLIMTVATAQETTSVSVTQRINRTMDDSNRFNLTTAMPFTNFAVNITGTTSEMNITNSSSTTTMATTHQTSKTTQGGKIPTTAISIAPSKTTSTTTKVKDKESQSQSSDATGIVIIIIIIVVAIGCAVACYIVRNRGRRYSIDFVSRQDEANIPLSIVDPELPGADTVPQNGLQTFENTETTAKAPEEAKTDPKGEGEEEKSKSVAAEADKSAVDPSAESAAVASSPSDSEDKTKEDVAKPTSPTPAPEQPSPEEKTNDEATVSNKTSVESQKETNDNNSNNAVLRQKRDLDASSIFWVVPLDSPV